MKKLALVTSFCDNQEKINVLENTIDTLKNLGLDTIFYTALHLPEKIYKKSDYVIISKENPVFDWPVKAYYQWSETIFDNFKIHLSRTYPDYGYAVLNQIKRMSELALTMDYDHFFVVDYDTNINDHVKNILSDNKPNSFFPSKRENTLWDIGLHLISLDKKHLTNFKNLITPESYLTEKNGDAFSWTHKALPFVSGIIEDGEAIEDLIYKYQDFDFFNYSKIEGVKLFIHKYEIEEHIKLLFYNFDQEKTFTIKTEDFKQEYTVSSWDEINVPNKIYNSFIIIYKEQEYDYTTTINQIKLNLFNKTPLT